MHVFGQMLRSQWKWSWGAVVLCTLAAFSVPIISVQGALVRSDSAISGGSDGRALYFLQVMEQWSVLYTVIAAAIGLFLATLAWSSDHRGKHVYALVLPIERWRYVLFRYCGGLLLLLTPALALWVGASLAVASTVIPAGLTAYPAALAIRFALAAVVAYSLFFAISSATTRAAAVVLAPIVLLIVADVVLASVGIRADLVERIGNSVFEWPGILEIFTGRWLLVDV